MTTVNIVNLSMQLCGSAISLLVMLCLALGSSQKTSSNRLYVRMLLCNTAVMLFDVLALVFRGQTTSLAFAAVRLGNMASYLFNYLLLAIFVRYLTELLKQRTSVSRVPLAVTRALCGVSMLLVLVTQYIPVFYTIDAQNIYHRASGFWFSQAMGIVSIAFCGWMLIRYRAVIEKQERIALWSYVVLPVVALVLQICFYGLAFLNLANTIALILVFLFLQAQQGRRLAEQENRHTQDRMDIMLSQIQPHFLFNTLNSIYYLCGRDPQLAQEAIKDFSSYLRMNIDSLKQSGPIPFSKEMEHVKTYLWLEQMRFGGELTVETDIRCEDFLLPALSVQPIVENAVQHGACSREEGGTVLVAADETPDEYVITVKDNGPGFDVNKMPEDGRSHIGIRNVQQRLAMLCGGTLHVISIPGEGTTVEIRLPKEGPYAHHRG